MLHVKTELRASSVEGIGLHAMEDIPKGALIWSFCELTSMCIPLDVWEKYKAEDSVGFWNVEKYGYLNRGVYVVNTDDSRHMNHSNDSNTFYDYEHNTVVARRDIKAGEELTGDYREFCEEDLSQYEYIDSR